MVQPQPAKRYRCRCGGHILNARLPVPQVSDGGMRLGHLSQQHPTEVEPCLDQMRIPEDIATVAAEAFEVVEEQPLHASRVRCEPLPVTTGHWW
jgi:hypothetical protein